MATIASGWIRDWAGQLSEAADHVLSKVPDEEEWNVVRYFLQNVSKLFRRGDVKAGVKAFYRILPHVQRLVSNVEKTVNCTNSYEITDSVSQHFLVDENAREDLEKFMLKIKTNILLLQNKITSYAKKMDTLLEEVIEKGEEVGIFHTIKLGFQMNRISALIKACENDLVLARQMIDDLDTHIAGKTFLAHLLSYVSVILGLGFSATGNLPIGAACFTAATASRKSISNLADYRKELAKLDRDHKELQSELAGWRHRFRAEQLNFFLLIGLKRALVYTLLLAVLFFLTGKVFNYIVFSAIILYLVVRSEVNNDVRYYAGMGLGVLAGVIEYTHYGGLASYNTLSCLCVTLGLMGIIEL